MKKISCGIILYDRATQEILLCKPTGVAHKNGNYTFPKGEKHENETDWVCAKREFNEETGLTIPPQLEEKNSNVKFTVFYKNKKKQIYKEVHLFFVAIDNKNEINLQEKKPQFEEVDWVEFVPVDEAKKMIFWRFKDLVDMMFSPSDDFKTF